MGPPSLPFSARGTHTETGWRRDAKARGFLNFVFKRLTGKTVMLSYAHLTRELSKILRIP